MVEWSVVISIEELSSANVFSEWIRKGVRTMRSTVKRLLRRSCQQQDIPVMYGFSIGNGSSIDVFIQDK